MRILLLQCVHVNCNHWLIMKAWTSLDAVCSIRFTRKLRGVDAMAKNKPSQGARKTETLTLRLDPKVKAMIEIISRIRRQSITGVVEAAIEEIAFDLDAPYFFDGKTLNSSLGAIFSDIWSSDESERFINMCYHLPSLMTYEEQRIWETIKSSRCFWENAASKILSDWSVVGLGCVDISNLRLWWNDLLDHVEAHKDSRTVVPFEPAF